MIEIDVFVADILNSVVDPLIQVETAVPAVKTAVKVALSQAQVESASLSVLLTNDAEVLQLNRDYRDEDRPTDVLSFPAGDELDEYLGDIAISVETAVVQAKNAGHGAVEELQLLAVHGTLHLLGYDHLNNEEKEAMWAVQTAVLNQLNLGHVIPTEDPHD